MRRGVAVGEDTGKKPRSKPAKDAQEAGAGKKKPEKGKYTQKELSEFLKTMKGGTGGQNDTDSNVDEGANLGLSQLKKAPTPARAPRRRMPQSEASAH